MEEMTEGVLVVFRSEDGRNGWYPVKQEDVPDWVKDPDNMARLVDGEACMDATSESGTDWFTVIRVVGGEEAQESVTEQAH